MAGLTFVNQVGAVEGMNQAAPGTLIPESFVRWSQDVLFDRAGLMRRRGPFSDLGIGILNANADLVEERVIGSVFTYTPSGDTRIGVIVNVRLTTGTFTILRVFDGSFVYLGSEIIIAQPVTGSNTVLPEFRIVSTHNGAQGGIWIIISDSNVDASKQYQFYWHGGSGVIPNNDPVDDTANICRASQFTGNVAVENLPGRAASAGLAYSSIITVSDTSKLSKGQFVYAVGAGTYEPIFVGVIKSISSNVSITLEKRPNVFNNTVNDNNALVALSNVAFYATSVRPYEHVHGRGLITTTNNNPIIKSGAIGGLAEGHWKSAGISNTWNVYRSSDNAFLGKITSVTDNATATLSANPNIDIAADEYVMQNLTDYTFPYWQRYVGTNDTAINFAGSYTSTYQGLQWWAGISTDPTIANRVTFSAPHNGEAVDLSLNAADSIVFPGNSQVRGIASTVSGLVVFLDNTTYIIRGSNRTNFTVEQLYPEGCLSAASIVEYNGGVFWAGVSGFFFFDGSSVRNIVQDSMGQYYSDGLERFNPEEDTIYTWVYNNYVFITFSNFASPYIPVRYEGVYEEDWNDNPNQPQLNRTWNDLISGDAVGVQGFGFDYNDFEGPNPLPFYWNRFPLIGTDTGVADSLKATWTSTAGGPINWESGFSNYVWTGSYASVKTALTFGIYLPTLALTTFKNLQINAASLYETSFGSRGFIAINSVENKTRMRIVDPSGMLDYDTNGQDAFTFSLNNVASSLIYPGPDFYLQTKCFTVGDPILRKWFQRLLMDMVLQDGAIRVDFVDSDDNDDIDISIKKPKTWQVFTPNGYNWRYLTTVVFKGIASPLTPSWGNIQDAGLEWTELTRSDYERYTKRFSWRKSGLGFRIYQLNNYRTNSAITAPDKPERVDIQGFTIGFKPLRSGRQ